MKLRTFVIIFGVILILLQAVAFVGMSRVSVGLYPEMEDVWNPNYFYSDNISPEKKIAFAFTAGFERFMTSFSDLTFDIENEYRNTSPTQYMSTNFRHSLKYDNSGVAIGFSFLTMYDAALTLSYSITGLIGLACIGLSFKIKK